MNQDPSLENIRRRYEQYVKGAYDTTQLNFWLLFWGGAIVSCGFYYLYIHQEWQNAPFFEKIGHQISMGTLCAVFPLLLLKRLHPLALLVALACL